MSARKTTATLDDPDLAEFKAESKPCKVARSIEHLSEASDKRKVQKALAHIDVKHQAIADFFQSRALPLSTNVVADHRKGRCSCHR